MLNPNEIEKRLEELKDCKKIAIIVDNKKYIADYDAIINNPQQEFIIIDAIFEYDKKMFLYCSISDILPA